MKVVRDYINTLPEEEKRVSISYFIVNLLSQSLDQTSAIGLCVKILSMLLAPDIGPIPTEGKNNENSFYVA